MSSSAVPELPPTIPAGQHPIETMRYVLPTPAIAELHAVVERWTDNRVPGGVIVGRPRLGKTRALKYVTGWLAQELGPVPILQWRCREYKTPSEAVFFEDLLRASGHALVHSGKPAAKRDRLTQWLWEQAHRSGQNRLLLFTDDAQRLDPRQFNWLMDVYNDLDAMGVSLITILVGQDQLVSQRSAFIEAQQYQIVGRFMVQVHHFYGVRSQEDMQVCLTGYDTATEYPEGTGWSFSRYYFPARFDTGWRLQEETKKIWDGFAHIRQEHAIPRSRDIPMQYFTRTVEYLLRRGAAIQGADPIPESLVLQAIYNSGYADAETLWD